MKILRMKLFFALLLCSTFSLAMPQWELSRKNGSLLISKMNDSKTQEVLFVFWPEERKFSLMFIYAVPVNQFQISSEKIFPSLAGFGNSRFLIKGNEIVGEEIVMEDAHFQEVMNCLQENPNHGEFFKMPSGLIQAARDFIAPPPRRALPRLGFGMNLNIFDQ